MTELGDLQMVNLRAKWIHEAHDFTPWLAQNIHILSHALGLELEVESTEVAVGPYAADILAKDAGTGKYVVIENQLEKTDHDHLGKSITKGWSDFQLTLKVKLVDGSWLIDGAGIIENKRIKI